MANTADIANLKNLIAKMTLEEKIKLIVGADSWHTAEIRRLGVPSMMMTDGPHGLRKERDGDETVMATSEPATCFPTAAALSCSFDEDLLAEVGRALALEAKAAGVSVVLGPGVNIKRSPLCGRNFEYFSEDPYLAGRLGAAYINGMQTEGVGVCLKHFALNNQETERFTSSSNADMRTMRELYLRPFELAVKGGDPASVMSSYNLVNGEYVGESPLLLSELLRRDWGFNGCVISDWGAVHNRPESIAAGLDLEMPGNFSGNQEVVSRAIESGELKEWQLDNAVLHVLELVSRCKSAKAEGQGDLLSNNHRRAAKAAAECCVLLKNNNHMLPLSKSGQSIAVIGYMAKKPRIQGAGSSSVNCHKVVSLIDELDSRDIAYSYAPGCAQDGSTNDELISEALCAAKNCDAAVIVIGLPDEYESEGFDRTDLALPAGMLKLVSAVLSVNSHVTVVLQLGAPVELPFLKNIDALLLAYLGGQGGGAGIADVLFGKHNPSGRLAESWPVKLADLPQSTLPTGRNNANYTEGIYSGYRYFDMSSTKPMFPFGFGLSYSSFSLGRPSLSDGRVAAGGSFELSLSVTNTSGIAGTETLLVFAEPTGSARKLVAFKKVRLLPGERADVSLRINADDFAYFNTATGRFELTNGEVALTVCGANETVTAAIVAESDAAMPPYLDKNDLTDNAAWRALGCKPYEPKVKPCGLNSTLGELKHTAVGKIVYSVYLKQSGQLAGDVGESLIIKSADDMPLRVLVAFSRGMLSRKRAEGIADLANGRFFKGLKKLI